MFFQPCLTDIFIRVGKSVTMGIEKQNRKPTHSLAARGDLDRDDFDRKKRVYNTVEYI